MIDTLLVIGRRHGMEEIIAQAASQAREIRSAGEISSALQAPWTASLLLVLQHWPDEYAPGEINRLLAAYPLARIIVCQGPWCASDGRTRQYWPPAVCVPLGEASRRVSRELDVLIGRRAPLPWTAGVDEIFAFDHAS
jgi:hypothetical protein